MIYRIIGNVLIVSIFFILLAQLILVSSGSCLEHLFSSVETDAWEIGELLKLLFLSIVALVLLFFTKKISRRISFVKIKIINKVIIISISLFIIYGYKIYSYGSRYNDIVNNKDYVLHESICDKIKPFDGLLETSSKGTGLSIKEYNELRKYTWFPSIAKEAMDINYEYSHEDLLPDYVFNLYYKVPKSVDVKLIDISREEYYEHQSFEVNTKYKIVNYSKKEW